MTNLPKRLIEVDLPIRRISQEAAAEMEKRRGHIPMMHIWWAHRPPTACRSVLLASLIPDPCDENIEESVVDEIKKILSDFQSRYGKGSGEITTKEGLRNELIRVVEFSAYYDLRYDVELIGICSRLCRLLSDGNPTIYDFYAGGSIIPYEGIRFGLTTYASDLNPVAGLINKIILEALPAHKELLCDKLEKEVELLHSELRSKHEDLYPAEDGEAIVGYINARKIKCEGPSCGYELPLLKQPILSRKGKNKYYLELDIKEENKSVEFTVKECEEFPMNLLGTMKGSKCVCPQCGYTNTGDVIKRQISLSNGGSSDYRILAVCVDLNGRRQYRSPKKTDYDALDVAKKRLGNEEYKVMLPCELIPEKGRHRAVGSQLPLYGFKHWADLHTPRQLVVLSFLTKRVSERYEDLKRENGESIAQAITGCLGLLVNKLADMNTALCVWQTHANIPAHLFGRKALPWVTDFAESNPTGKSSGTLISGLKRTITVMREYCRLEYGNGNFMLASSSDSPLPDESVDVLFTDPPYYDSVPYADLSDFFYVWTKRSCAVAYPDLFKAELTNKTKEATVNRPNNNEDYERYVRLLSEGWKEARRVIKPNGIAVIVFAHKSTRGWESLLTSLLDQNWQVLSSWPIDTEMQSRMNAKGTASLQSSIHLVCKPRSENAPIGEWRDVLSELPLVIRDWLPRLASEGIVGADAVFACIGPALEIYSRYRRVEEANGDAVSLKRFLEAIWGTVSKEALSSVVANADLSSFESDARLSAMWLWTVAASPNGNDEEDKEVDTTKIKPVGFALEYDAARKIAQGLGANLDDMKSIVEVKGDKALLLPVAQRTEYLFGKGESAPESAKGRKKKNANQMDMFAELIEDGASDEVWEEKTVSKPGETILDRVHQAMILFASGRGEALKRFLVDDGVGQDPGLWKLAQAFSALYPPGTQEKRWVDGVLARKKGLGL